MAALGALDISVSANFARFASDMGRVVNIAETSAARIDKVLGVVSTGLKSIGAGFAIGLTLEKVRDKINGAIEAAAGLKILAERTGATVEGLSSLAATAKLSGTDTDQLATGLQKLSKALVDAKDGGAKTGEAFRAIGISTKELVGLRPDQAFALIATQLNKYADGAEKTAIAQVIFGKAGANLLAVLQDQAIVGKLVTKTTDEQATAADEYTKNLKRLEAVQNSLVKVVANELVPVFDIFVKSLLDSATEAGGLKGAIDDLARDGSIREWAENAVKSVGFVIDAFQGVGTVVQVVGRYIGGTVAGIDIVLNSSLRQVGGRIAALRADVESDVDKILQKSSFSDRLADRFQIAKDSADSGVNFGHEGRRGKDRPTPKFRPNTAEGKGEKDGDRVAKTEFEGRLKALDAFIKQEAEKLAVRQKSIDFFSNLEFFSVREAEQRKQVLIADELNLTQKAYDKEIMLSDRRIASLEASAAKAKRAGGKTGPAQAEKFDAEVIAARTKRAEIFDKAAESETKANQAIGDSINKLLAIKVHFDLATAEGERQAEKAAQTEAFAIGLLGAGTLEAQQRNTERRIEIALQERIFQLRKEDPTVDVSKAVAASEREKAAAIQLVAERYEKERSAGFGASEAFRKYIEDAQNAAGQVENALTNAFKGAEDALVNFVKTGKLDFKSLIDSIITDIARMAVKSALGGQPGDKGGGLVGLLGGFLGIGNGNTNPQGIGGSYTTGGSGIGGFFASLAGIIGGFGGGGFGANDVGFSNAAGISGGRASGGPVNPNTAYRVGENGPETLRMAGQGGYVYPNGSDDGSGGTTKNVSVNLTQNFPPETSRATASQAAVQAAQALRQASRDM